MSARGACVVMLNTEDTRGGAARAARRLHRSLRDIGVDSRFVVQRKQTLDPSVSGPTGPARNFLRAALDLAPTFLYPRRDRGAIFYPGWVPDGVGRRVKGLAPDLVHLHWITRGFLNVRSLRGLGLPIVWTLHDMWAFTGGCHYDNACGRYQEACGHCPALGSMNENDLSRHGWQRKRRAYRNLPLTLVSPSTWLGTVASRSALLSDFPLHVIPNGIDTQVYDPSRRALGRKRIGIPADKRIILFGAANAVADPRKGMQYLEQALRILAAEPVADRLVAVVFGSPPPKSPRHVGVETVYPGFVGGDEQLAELYSAADVFVAPSLQENLSNTVMEALSCGTPCVAFAVGGMGDMIEHRENGYLARPADADDLAAGLRWVLEDEPRRAALSAKARAKAVAEFEAASVARRHLELYESILAGQPGRGSRQ